MAVKRHTQTKTLPNAGFAFMKVESFIGSDSLSNQWLAHQRFFEPNTNGQPQMEHRFFEVDFRLTQCDIHWQLSAWCASRLFHRMRLVCAEHDVTPKSPLATNQPAKQCFGRRLLHCNINVRPTRLFFKSLVWFTARHWLIQWLILKI